MFSHEKGNQLFKHFNATTLKNVKRDYLIIYI